MSARFKVGDRVTALPWPKVPKWDEDWASFPNPGNVGRTGTVIWVADRGLKVHFGPDDIDYARFAYWAKADTFTPGDVVTLKSGDRR